MFLPDVSLVAATHHDLAGVVDPADDTLGRARRVERDVFIGRGRGGRGAQQRYPKRRQCRGVFTQLGRIADTQGGAVTPTGISPWGLVVGYAERRFKGFAYSTIQHRAYSLNINHRDTYPVAINRAGQVVGFIADPVHVSQAFLYHYGSYTLLAPPGLSGIADTTANWVNDSGQVVGVYDTADRGYQGYSYYKGKYTTLTAPDGSAAYPYFVSASGDITGSFKSTDQGFILSGGKYTIVSVGGITGVLALNADGEAIGNYFRDIDSEPHIFRLSGGVVRPADPPGTVVSASPKVGGLNEAGSFIETYSAFNFDLGAIKSHAFVAVCDPPGSRCGD